MRTVRFLIKVGRVNLSTRVVAGTAFSLLLVS